MYSTSGWLATEDLKVRYKPRLQHDFTIIYTRTCRHLQFMNKSFLFRCRSPSQQSESISSHKYFHKIFMAKISFARNETSAKVNLYRTVEVNQEVLIVEMCNTL